MKLILLFLIVVTVSKASVWDSLTATIAVVEFHTHNTQNMSEISQNILDYKNILMTLSKTTKLDMIIFPEGSIQTSPNTAIKLQVGENPCKGEGNYPHFFTELSCAALKYNTYLVTNTIERVKCKNPSTSKSEHCRNFGFYYYNTDVVFDRTGKLAYRYRKFSLLDEFQLDRPDKPETVTFTTDFGVKFGIFTCFDLLFKSLDLFALHVDGIIYQTLWYSELPFLTSLQVQQMLAYSHNTMFFAAGGNRPEKMSGGTGIFRGANDTFATTLEAKGKTHILTYRSVKGKTKKILPQPVDTLGKEMDSFPIKIDDSISNYNWKPVNTSKKFIQDQVCYEQFCCDFKMDILASKSDGLFYSYLMVAFHGVRKNAKVADVGLEVCGVIACLNASISTCGRRFPKYETVDWPVTFKTLSIKGEFDIDKDKVQFPNSLLSSIRPIDAFETDWTNKTFKKNGKEMVERTFELTKPQNRLFTFAIYGRNYAKDSSFRDKVSNSEKHVNGHQDSHNSSENKKNDNDNAGSSVDTTFFTLGISLCLTLLLKF